MHDSVTVHMTAPPQRIWELVSDVTRIGSYSPRPSRRSGWRRHRAGGRGPVPRPRQAQRQGTDLLDDVHRPGLHPRERVHLRRRPRRQADQRVELPVGAVGDGTDVTESFTLADKAAVRVYWALLGWARGRTNRNGMRTTLERIKAEVEVGPAGAVAHRFHSSATVAADLGPLARPARATVDLIDGSNGSGPKAASASWSGAPPPPGPGRGPARAGRRGRGPPSAPAPAPSGSRWPGRRRDEKTPPSM